MIKRITGLFSVLTAIVLLTGCANMYFKQGNKLYDNLRFSKAADYFSKTLEKKDIPAARVGLANAYRQMNNTAKAEEFYAQVVAQPEVDPINYFHYARMLMANGKYAEAKIWFNKYLSVKPDDETAKVLLASCDSTTVFYADSLRFKVGLVQLKGLENYYSTTLYKDGFIFAGDKDEVDVDKVNPWTGNSYLDLYYTQKEKGGDKWETPKAIEGQVNGPFHEGPSAITPDGKMIYFTRSDYKGNNRMAKSKTENTNNLQLYSATLDGDKWKDVKPFAFNSHDFSTGHPTFSPDGQIMYIVSDRPGGQGGTDIWMCNKAGEGWGEPINLGPTINTSLNEMFPFFSAKDSTLYFSSQGHTNMGGLDIFSTKNVGDNKWSRPINIGYPINTTHDDFAFTMKDDLINGFVSSTRQDGTDKIYSFKREDGKPLEFVLIGTVTDKNTGAVIPNSKVEVINMETNTKIELYTGSDGGYKIPLSPNTSYTIIASKEKYSTATGDATTVGLKKSETIRRDFVLENFLPVANKEFVIDNIYYDLDKYNIRPDAAEELDKIVQLMKEYPNMVIELGSHTDSRASDQYNITLSENRAKSAVAYLVKRGISKDRMYWKGYGETKLVNGCSNDVKCTEAEHQKNRRTTFKVLSY